jgi:hypothetical protein
MFPAQLEVRHQWRFTHDMPTAIGSSISANPIQVAPGSECTIHSTGVGRVHVQVKANGYWNDIAFRDIRFLPEFHRNLLSAAQITRRTADSPSVSTEVAAK